MNRGGLETMLMNYYRKIDRKQIQFDFMVHREEKGIYEEEIEELGGRIYRMPPIRPGNYRSYFRKLDEFFQKNREYRIVHAHINENSSFVLRAAKKADIPIRIAHSHLSDLGIDYKLPFRLYAKTYLEKNTNHFFACSKNAGEWLYGKSIKNSNNFTVMKNAVNAEDFAFNADIRNQMIKDLGIENKLVIGHIGRFDKQKNHDFLIDIFKSVNDLQPNTILLLIGTGHLKEAIEQKVKSLGLDSSVKFLGVRQDISHLMQVMDLFLFPSLYEGLPVVLIEAQAAGLKCMVSDTITKETDITGRIEFLSLKNSPSQWAEKILLTNKERTDTLSLLKNSGYDTTETVNWLNNFYINSYNQNVVGGF